MIAFTATRPATLPKRAHFRAWSLKGAATLLAVVPCAFAAEVSLSPARDTTIFSESTDFSNGIGAYMFAGQTRLGGDRRALLAFDLSSVPTGSTITSAALTLFLSQAPPESSPVVISAHRVLAPWGEGLSDTGTPGGFGITAENGDATWLTSFYPATEWSNPGGDFAPASATLLVGAVGFYTLSSGPALVADVQGWLDTPASSQGWIIIGGTTTGTARRFDSRESETPANRPMLSLTFTPPLCRADLDNGSGTGTPDGGVDINDLLFFLTQFELGSPQVDLNDSANTGTPDGGVDISDLLFFLARFEAGC